MARSPKIRITQNDRKEYQRLRKNAKSKVARVKKNYGVDLTGEIDLTKSMNDFLTRKEYNAWKEKQAKFTNRSNTEYQFVKNKYDVVASKKEIYDITKATKRAQRLAKKELDKYMDKTVHYRGKPFETVEKRTTHFSVPDVTGISVPKDFKFEDVRNYTRLTDIKESAERKSKNDYYDTRKAQMKVNFINALEGSFNSESAEIVDMIKAMDSDIFYEFYLSFPDVFDFNLYDSDGQDVLASNNALSEMTSYIKDYNLGKFDFDLKDF